MKRSTMKRAAALLAAGCMTVSLAACGSTAHQRKQLHGERERPRLPPRRRPANPPPRRKLRLRPPLPVPAK